jgi:hypothetical protein
MQRFLGITLLGEGIFREHTLRQGFQLPDNSPKLLVFDCLAQCRLIDLTGAVDKIDALLNQLPRQARRWDPPC